MNIKCCFQCVKRHVGCHSECPDYIAERKALDEENELRFKEYRVKQNICERRTEAITKAIRRKR